MLVVRSFASLSFFFPRWLNGRTSHSLKRLCVPISL
jgi:hypothetical protein